MKQHAIAIAIALSAPAFSLGNSAEAAIVTFTDRVAWETAAGGNVIVQDFEGLDAGVLTQGMTHSLGIADFSFTGNNVSDTPRIGTFNAQGMSGQVLFGNVFKPGSGGGTSSPGPHLFELAGPVSGIGADIADLNAAGLIMDVLGESLDISATIGGLAGFFGIVSDTPLTSFSLSAGTVDNVANEYFYLDNLSIVVPLPAAVWLLGGGLLALFGYRRYVA